MKKTYQYNVIFRAEPEGGYTVMVPALPGCVTYSKTLIAAKRMALDAIEAYCTSLKKHNESIPSDEGTFVASLNLERAQTS